MGSPAITASGVGKTFVLPHEKRDTLREWVASGFRRMRYDRFDALRDVSFEVEAGSCFGIIGRNGSGKSTLLKILAGIFPPNAGSVAVRGRISPFLELGVGFNPDLSARDNVYLNAAVLGLRRREIDAAFDEIIAFAELERFVDQRLKNFSSGMHVRLAFSVAIKAQADVYLMDEVLAVGDLAFQQKCFDVFRRFRAEGRTIVLVSHDLASIRNYCERTLYLKDGEVVALGPTAEVLDRYVYEDRAVVLPQAPLGTDAAGIRSPVRIVGARVLDRAGRLQRQLLGGDAMAIEIDYAADSDAANVVLELTLADPRGTVLFTVDSAAFDLRPPAAAGTLRFSFPSPVIGEGHVRVAAAARSRDGTLFHHRDLVGEFDVLAGPGHRGLLRMPVSATFVPLPDH
jgi:lipopolysaccharide transport system ATP-binding protein